MNGNTLDQLLKLAEAAAPIPRGDDGFYIPARDIEPRRFDVPMTPADYEFYMASVQALPGIVAELASYKEALEAVWKEGVTAGALKEKVKTALWPETKRW